MTALIRTTLEEFKDHRSSFDDTLNSIKSVLWDREVEDEILDEVWTTGDNNPNVVIEYWENGIINDEQFLQISNIVEDAHIAKIVRSRMKSGSTERIALPQLCDELGINLEELSDEKVS